MKSALSGGASVPSVRCRPMSMMLSVRVPGGTKSGRPRRCGLLGNAYDAPRAVDDRHEVQVRPRDVAAPGDDQLRVLRLLRLDPGHRTERADPGLGADAAAEWPAIEQARAEPVEEAEIHRATGQQSVRPGVVERQDRLRAVRGHHGGESFVDDVERLRPRDTREAPLALRAHAPERRLETPLAVHEAGIRLRNL